MNGGYENPSIEDFKTFFSRDFPYSTDPNLGVTDTDIARAFNETDAVINQGLFSSQDIFTLGFEYLAAHNMVMNIQASGQGLSGQFDWMVQSKSVGSVSEGLAIPDRILQNPEFAYLTKTNYGVKYLMLILPNITGQIYSVCGYTHP